MTLNQKQEENSFIVKPKVNLLLLALRYSFFLIAPVLFLFFFLATSSASEKSLLPTLIFIMFIWFMLWIVFIGISYLTLKNAEYHFLDHKLEYYNSFARGNNFVLYYKNMSLVRIRRGLSMRMFGLATVYVRAHKSIRTNGKKLLADISINTVKDYDNIHIWLRSRIK